MGNRVIRVSQWAADELKRRAAEERRTVVAVVDGLLVGGARALRGPGGKAAIALGRPDGFYKDELTYEPEQ